MLPAAIVGFLLGTDLHPSLLSFPYLQKATKVVVVELKSFRIMSLVLVALGEHSRKGS